MENNDNINNQEIKAENKLKRNKNKIEGIIFARSCCCIGIVIFHYFAHSKGKFKLLYRTANSNFGYLFDISFFCISGAVLFYNYPKINSIKIFYFKRWKSILPSFYLCFLYFYLSNVFRYRKQIFKWTLLKFCITLLGLDGYLAYITNTCYLVGEWFLGAIIIIYLLFPILSCLLNSSGFLFSLILPMLNFYMYKTNHLIYSKPINLITCLTNFCFGILTIKFMHFFFKNIKTLVVSIIIFLLLSSIAFPNILIFHQIQGFSLFIILVNVGRYVMFTKLNKIFIELGNLSYTIFLYQHKIILDVLSVSNPTFWYLHLQLLAIVILLTIICSKIHNMVVNSIFKSNIFIKFESIIIFKQK